MSRIFGRIVSMAACSLAIAGALWAQQPTPTTLTLKDAIALALKQNLSVQVAETQVGETKGTSQRQFATLLPHVTGDAFSKLENNNLSILGVSLPGIPTVVGPFSYNDFRIAANQPVIDRQAFHNWKASQAEVQASKLDYQDSRDLVIRQTAGLYLTCEAALAEVEASQSRVTTSEALEKLARDQHDQALATGVDVVRAQVQLARDQQSLLVNRDNYETAILVLERFLGLEPGVPLDLAERLEMKHVAIPDVDAAVQSALRARPDYRSLLSQRGSLVEEQKATHARYLPTFSISGDYGALGRNFASMPGIGEIQGTISITLFDRDRTGEQTQITSRLQRLNDQIDDLSRGIKQEIRKALLDLDSTEQQVAVTQQALDLAQRELELSADRFRNGVVDNIEVITAQDAVAAAQDDRITALAQHADAVAALARALGGTEEHYQQFFEGSSRPDSERSK